MSDLPAAFTGTAPFRTPWLMRWGLAAGLSCWLIAGKPILRSLSQEPGRLSRGGSADEALLTTPGSAVGPDQQAIALPPPPETLGRLIRDNRVSFRFYDPKKNPREYSGETHFNVEYRFRAASRWTATIRGVQRQLIIRPRFTDVSLSISHSIELPSTLADDSFFSHPLVLHEFDHVRLSAAARWQDWFEQRLKDEVKLLRLPLSAREVPTEPFIQAQVRKATEEVFEQLVELIKVRYQELDRVTSHGIRSLPEDFFDEDKNGPDSPR